MAVDAPRAAFNSTHSLYDYDLVLWDPSRSLKPYLTRGYGAGSYNGFLPSGSVTEDRTTPLSCRG